MGKTQYKKSSQTQVRILDVAEELFAKQGFDATTTRQITAAAGVRNASINYYFETKRDLMVAVIDRRFDVLRRDREAMLAKVDDLAADTPAKIEAIVAAFVLPLAKLTQTDVVGWSNYNRIMAQFALRPEWPQDDYADKINKTAEKFIAQLSAVSPRKSRDEIIQAYQFVLGSVLFAFSENQRFAQVQGDGKETSQAANNPQPLVGFLAAGLLKLLG